MLKISNINTYYGNIHALKDVSLELKEGEIITLIGANGAGKSTTLMSVSGVVPISTGSVEFLGEDISTLNPDQIVEKGIVQVPKAGGFSPSSR
jgi:branched-chain amino acid transport system ATP-binding protein